MGFRRGRSRYRSRGRGRRSSRGRRHTIRSYGVSRGGIRL